MTDTRMSIWRFTFDQSNAYFRFLSLHTLGNVTKLSEGIIYVILSMKTCIRNKLSSLMYIRFTPTKPSTGSFIAMSLAVYGRHLLLYALHPCNYFAYCIPCRFRPIYNSTCRFNRVSYRIDGMVDCIL